MGARLQNQVETGEPSEAIVNECLVYFGRIESALHEEKTARVSFLVTDTILVRERRPCAYMGDGITV